MKSDEPIADIGIDWHEFKVQKEHLTKALDDHGTTIQSLLERTNESVANGGAIIQMILTTVSNPKDLIVLSKVLAKIAQIKNAMADPQEKLVALEALENHRAWLVSSVLSLENPYNDLIREVEQALLEESEAQD